MSSYSTKYERAGHGAAGVPKKSVRRRRIPLMQWAKEFNAAFDAHFCAKRPWLLQDVAGAGDFLMGSQAHGRRERRVAA